jgi:hypothetical protein
MGLASGIPYPGSGKKTHPGSWIQGSKEPRIQDPGSGSATLLKCWQISYEVLPGSSVWCISTATAMCMAVG